MAAPIPDVTISGDWIRWLQQIVDAIESPRDLYAEQIVDGKPLTKTDDVNVTIALGGTPATALLQPVSLTLGWTGVLGLTRGGTNAALTAANGGLVYSTASALAITAAGTSGQIVKSAGAGTPTWNTPAALTEVDDTNVTLTLGGSASTALVNAASITAGWTGLLGLARGGTNANLSATGGAANYLKQVSVGAAITVGTIPASDIVSGAALSKTDDTNVTLTLGGSPTTALLAATSLTLGWTGTLSVARGGIGVGTLASNGVLYGNGTSAVLALAVNATATRKFLSQTSSAAPTWNTVDAGELTGATLAAGVTASSLTSVGTLTGGATGAGFTVALSTSTITGTLADARLSANVPLLNAGNAFTNDNSFKTVNANIARSNSAGAGSIYFGPGGAASEWSFRDDLSDNWNLDYYNGSAWTGSVANITPTGDATFLGNMVVHATTSGSFRRLTLGGSPSVNGAAAIDFLGSNTQFNWRITSNNAIAGAFEIVQSTVAGGTLFSSNSALVISPAYVLTFNGVGSHAFTGGSNAAQELQITNTTSGTAAYAGFRATAGTNIDLVIAFSQGYTTSGVNIQSSMLLQSTGAGGLTLAATDAAGVIRMYTGGANLRWGVNAAGDISYGTGAHIAISGGTPSLAYTGTSPASLTSGSTDYSFTWTTGISNATVTITFGHTFTNAPSVVVSSTTGTVIPSYTVSTTQVAFSSIIATPGIVFNCIALGF